ncbi:MAG: bifunctional folylpolyglutamate synthase/dihydrofolate synthase [Bacteroidetes bacterium]|nr:bifunctional folylpolyglutamate synthase/dihydrofolate synthase [Bacteroidota bacterium]
MNYQDTMDWLFSQLPIYQRSGLAAYKADIGNIVAACEKLNNPHQQFKSIHIAGTNGKGSTAHMLASILQEAGYKTGLYTSPHLKDFRERIRVNGIMISERKVIDFVSNNKNWFAKIGMSFFEMTVAMAFDHFAKEQVDIAIIETGLGGRLDSTNILSPELCVITNIGLDHTALLGNTLEAIAQEKAGIIKANTPVVIGRKQKETKSVFQEKAEALKAPLSYATSTDLDSDLQGFYQKENIATAVSSIRKLQKSGWKIQEEHIQNGLQKVIKNTGILGRWQILKQKPLTICDTGHNEDGISNILEQLKKTPHKTLHFIFGTVNDKNTSPILEMLPKNASYYFCQANIPRALSKETLCSLARKEGLKGTFYPSVQDAFQTAQSRAQNKDLIFIGGSTFVVAEVL